MKEPVYMKIKELSQLTQTPPSTIRFYVKEGLLPDPIKTGKTMSYYSNEHLEQIEFIKKMQVEKDASIKDIKEKIKLKFKRKIKPPTSPPDLLSRKREEIITAAIDLFRTNGFTNTSITDIVKLAKIGRDTFYQNYPNKEELFLECADRVFFEMYNEIWEELKNEKDMKKRFIKRAEAFLVSYPKWIDMMNIIRGVSVNEKTTFINKLDKLMDQIIQPNINDVKKAQEQGYISKELDSVLLGHMIMGMAEYSANLLHQKQLDPKDISNTFSLLFDRLA